MYVIQQELAIPLSEHSYTVLLNDEVENLENVDDDTLRKYLDFANAYAANTTTKEGALRPVDKARWKNGLRNFNLELANCRIRVYDKK